MTKEKRHQSYLKYKQSLHDNPEKRLERNKKKLAQLQITKDYILSLKVNKPCVDCGKIYAPCAMDFDHVIGKKKFSLGSDDTYHSKQIIDEEVAKCVIRCAVCHRIKTHGCLRNRNIELALDTDPS